MKPIIIRPVQQKDHQAIWTIFQAVVQQEDTYVFYSSTSYQTFEKQWLHGKMKTFVAEIDNKIVGTYIIKPNQLDLGNHIANCSYMVEPSCQGNGIGSAMCEHSIKFAKKCDFKAIQFNIVVSSNKSAIELWQKFGFKIIGTTPSGFRHKTLGFVDTYIMFRNL